MDTYRPYQFGHRWRYCLIHNGNPLPLASWEEMSAAACREHFLADLLSWSVEAERHEMMLDRRARWLLPLRRWVIRHLPLLGRLVRGTRRGRYLASNYWVPLTNPTRENLAIALKDVDPAELLENR